MAEPTTETEIRTQFRIIHSAMIRRARNQRDDWRRRAALAYALAFGFAFGKSWSWWEAAAAWVVIVGSCFATQVLADRRDRKEDEQWRE